MRISSPPLEPTPVQVRANRPLQGRLRAPTGDANYADNFIIDADEPVAPGCRAAPASQGVWATLAAMENVDLDPIAARTTVRAGS